MTEIMKKLKDLSVDARKEFGKLANGKRIRRSFQEKD